MNHILSKFTLGGHVFHRGSYFNSNVLFPADIDTIEVIDSKDADPVHNFAKQLQLLVRKMMQQTAVRVMNVDCGHRFFRHARLFSIKIH